MKVINIIHSIYLKLLYNVNIIKNVLLKNKKSYAN